MRDQPDLLRGACSRSPFAALRTAYCHTVNVPFATSALATVPASLPPSAENSLGRKADHDFILDGDDLEQAAVSFDCAKAGMVQASRAKASNSPLRVTLVIVEFP